MNLLFEKMGQLFVQEKAPQKLLLWGWLLSHYSDGHQVLVGFADLDGRVREGLE